MASKAHTAVARMEDAWISPKSRRLSRLPVPVAGFKKTKVTSTFTASPLAATIPRSERTMVIETEGEDYEMMSSPAKIQKSSREAFKLPMSQSRRLTVAPTDCMITSDQPPCEAAQRRYSLAPRLSSLLATPPQRLVNTRQSLAPNPYGMHTGRGRVIPSVCSCMICRGDVEKKVFECRPEPAGCLCP